MLVPTFETEFHHIPTGAIERGGRGGHRASWFLGVLIALLCPAIGSLVTVLLSGRLRRQLEACPQHASSSAKRSKIFISSLLFALIKYLYTKNRFHFKRTCFGARLVAVTYRCASFDVGAHRKQPHAAYTTAATPCPTLFFYCLVVLFFQYYLLSEEKNTRVFRAAEASDKRLARILYFEWSLRNSPKRIKGIL